jgi:hypothetical protein
MSTDRLFREFWKRYRRRLAIGVILLAVALSSWMWSSGQLLTITKPVGGTIVGSGITCGTRGSDCSTTIATGDPVELVTEADKGFAFGGFTGDCAPAGRTVMTAARTCGATFNRITETMEAAGWPLTITPPVGGTVLAAGDIQCGSLGSSCAANLPDGVPITLYVQPDAGYTFLTFTGDCAPSGNTVMTGPRVCSATFGPTSGLSTSNPVVVPPRAGEPPPLAPPVVEDPLARPTFPWPPPRASSQAVIALQEQVGTSQTLSGIDRIISVALSHAGYDESSYFAVPGGFALVTRLEQTNADGSPKPTPERWSVRVDPLSGTFSLGNYLKALIGATPGYFRVIVFILTSVPFSQSLATVSRDESALWLTRGLNRLPDEIGQIPWSPQYSCTALVYEFESNNSKAVLRLPGRLTGKMHLEKASLLGALGVG